MLESIENVKLSAILAPLVMPGTSMGCDGARPGHASDLFQNVQLSLILASLVMLMPGSLGLYWNHIEVMISGRWNRLKTCNRRRF